MTMTTEETTWYEEWFQSEYYLKLYSHRNLVEAEACIDIILRAANIHPGEGPAPKALDVACGPGRHAISLAKRGFEVTAVDLSTSLLRYAFNVAQKEEVAINFVRSDMRDIQFVNQFELAVQLFTSFGYFDTQEDDMMVLQKVRRSLRDVGYYALDLINEEHIRKSLVRKNIRSIANAKITEERSINGDRVEKTITVQDGSNTHTFHESVQLYSPGQIERMLRAAGLLPVQWFGDYAGMPYDPERSTRMIIVSKAV